MLKRFAIAACCLLLAACCFAAEAPKLSGESPRTAQQFAEAADLEKRQRWADAVEVYLRLADDTGDDLVPSDGEPRLLLPAQKLVHRRIAARPELLAPYRARVEPRAKRLLEQGMAGRDRQLLEQVVDRFFCSCSADGALHLLGDLACEAGEFELARHYWHRLEPAASAQELAYPDPQGGPALARSKMILARLLAGERAAALAELQNFRQANPEATGHLAGHDGNLADILQSCLDAAETLRVPATIGIAPAPTTFAGDATRNGVLPGVLPPFSPQPRYPAISLRRPAASRQASLRPPLRPVSLPYYPVIAHGQVFVADARRVLAYDIATGQRSGRFELPAGGGEPADAEAKSSAACAFTLTVDGDRLYARIGPPHVRPARGEPSIVVCLQWQPDKPTPEERLKVRWLLPAAGPGTNEAAWEGAPVLRDGRLYAVHTRFDGGRAVTTIVCYPAADPSTGAIWRKDVFETSADAADRAGPRLLTLAGSTVALCSQAGVIVGLETATGRRAWALRYPQSSTATSARQRGSPAPCVFAAGRLFAAPSDSDRVYCLDAASGRPIWTSDPLAVTHLLGIVKDRVVCELGGFHAGLCALGAATGLRMPDWGYRVAGADSFAPFGRGLLFGDRVYWPTRAAGVQELRWDGSRGYIPTAFRELPGGNLAYGDGCLAVATSDRLHILVSEPTDREVPGRQLGELPLERRHGLLLWRAELLHQAGRLAEARTYLEQAAGSDYPPARRCLAFRRWAELEREAGHDGAADALIQTVATSDELSGVTLRDADGKMWTSAVVQASRLHHAGGTPARWSERVQPELHFPLEETWRLPLDRGREWALLPDHDPEPDHVFVAGHTWLACRNFADGTTRWRQKLPFAPNWLTVINGSLIAAGDNGAARLNAADGRPDWRFRVPESAPWFDRPGWRDPDAIVSAERLEGFQWAGGRLFARLGSRMLVALDGETGKLLWQRSALPGGSFQPAYFADEHCVVAQSADGRRWAFDAVSGDVLHTGPAPTDPWHGSPILLDGQRVLVVEDGRLVALDRTTWKPAWTWDLPRPPSLSGELPQTRFVNDELLVGVPRNECYEIERLDPASGKPLAAEGVVVGTDRVDLNAVAVNDELLHVIADGEFKWIDVHSGRILKRQRLPEAAAWRIEPAGEGLILWTVPAVSATDAPNPGQVLVQSLSEPEQPIGNATSLPLKLGTGNALRAVRVVGGQLVIVSESEIRGYRGAKREDK